MVDAEKQVLVGLELERQGDVDCAGVEYAELGEYPLVAAFGYHGHLLPFLQPQGHESGREYAALVPGFPE